MIRDTRALRPQFVPQELHHRNGQIDHLSSALCPVTATAPAENVCIVGPSGAGKTTLAKHTLGLLESETRDVRWAYVTCVAESSRSAVLHRLVQESGLGSDLSREGTHPSTMLDRIREYDGQFIAVIDEVDVLDEPRLLLSLYEQPNVAMVLITAAEEAFFAGLGSRAASRLRTAAVIRLEKYSHDELADILQGRVDHGLIASRVDEEAIERGADLAAGDARRGIALLRRAARYVAERAGQQRLTAGVVDGVEDEAVADMRSQRVSSLGPHQRLLYELIQAAGRIDSETLHACYEQQAATPRAKSTRRTYLQRLERYELVEAHGRGRGTEYTVYPTS